MAKGFDELVDFLRDEVALRFAEGATLDDFKTAVDRFYAEKAALKAAEDANVDASLVSAADRQLHEKAWTWLLLLDDIWVGRATDQDSPPEILVTADQDSSALSLVEAEAADLTHDESRRIRVWTSHERVWQTVAGHGVDFKRIPGEEFRLLCLIAGAGVKGIAQPDLVKMSKQDKKSVPGRTDNLHKGAYIRKTKILAEKHNTSLLVHRRFLPEEELDAFSRPVFINGTLAFENLLSVLKERLKNGVSIKMEELEEFLGCAVRSWEKRALWRALERLDIIGVIQRFRLDEVREGKRGNMRNFKTKYVKLLRDPTDADFKRYTSLTLKDREDFRRRLEAQDAETKGEHAEYMDDDDYAPQTTTAATLTAETVVAATRTMSWDCDVAWTNTIFNAVEAAGVAGLSSMSSREATYGRFYDRPVEQMLARLTDVWQKAQPDHLKSFSIIRDTDTKGRSTNYLYRTHDSFQQAVDHGLTVWENATSGHAYEKPLPELDQFGFSPLDSSQFVEQGTATIGECIEEAQVEPEATQRSDPILAKNPDGSFRVVWKHDQVAKKPKKGRPNAVVQNEIVESDLPVTPKPRRGRPPKNAPKVQSKKDTAADPSKGVVPQAQRTSLTSDELRKKAEEQVYHACKEEQKSTPITSASGTQIPSTWKPGQGRAKIILIDDVTSTGEDVELPQPAPGSRKPPVVVLESRVRAIIETLEAPDDAVPANAAKEAGGDPEMPQVERQVVMLKSPRLDTLGWFREDAEGTRRERDDTVINGTDQTLVHVDVTAATLPTVDGLAKPNTSGITNSLLIQERDPVKTSASNSTAKRNRSGRKSGRRPVTPPATRKESREDQPNVNTNDHTATNIVPDQDVAQSITDIGEGRDTQQDAAQATSNDPEIPETPTRRDWSQRQSTYVRLPASNTSHRKKKGTVVGRGTAQYKRILMVEQIMDKSGGIFPGDSEMVPAFQKLQKDELKSDTTSDRDTIMKAVKSLVDDGKLARFAFFFKDRNGKQVQKWILHHLHIKPNAPDVQDLMKKIEDAYPKNYVPPPYGDGETGRQEQRKNIDRFQYRPGKSIIQPSGTDFVIDIDAKRKELEARRLAAAAAIRAEESRRLKAQAERNKKRQAALVGKLRAGRASLHKTAHPDADQMHLIDEDDPDNVMPSVEVDGVPARNQKSGRARYRSIRPAPPISEAGVVGTGSEFRMPVLDPFGNKLPQSENDTASLSTGQPRLQRRKRRATRSQLAPATIAPARLSGFDRTLVPGTFVFKEPLAPQSYDQFYEIEDVQTLLRPLQRFHPNTGTFSTDFLIRTNVRHSYWLEPGGFTFEHHTATNPEDVEWYTRTNDVDNFYHPEKKMRRRMQRDSDEESDAEFDAAWLERQEQELMKKQYPDLVQEPVLGGFVNLSFGGVQEVSKEMYRYGIRPMEHIVLHGAEPEDFHGVQFEDHNRRPNLPIAVQEELGGDEHSESDLETIPHVATRRRRGARRDTTTRFTGEDGVLPFTQVRAPLAEKRTGHQSGKCFISSADSRRLFFACIAVRVLSGELEGNISWNSIRQVFAEHENFDLPTFKARWHRMTVSYKDVIDRVHREFQDAFIDAYGKGLLPAMDVMHGAKLYYKNGANWNHLVDWAVRTIPVFPDEIGLPSTRSKLDKSFDLKTRPSELQDMREKMEHLQSTNAKREDISHSISFAVPLPRKSRNAAQNVEIAKSLVRANCAASDENYDPATANAKLKKLDQGMLMAVTKQLHAEKIIAHSFKLRNKATRNYHLSDQYNQIFNKRALDAGHFADALAFKIQLDKVFASRTPRLLLDYGISDGAVIAITELLAAGRLLAKPILPPVDSTIGATWPRLTVWGFTEGHYKLRNMDRKTFLWDIELVPTSSYVRGIPTAAKRDKIPPPMAPKTVSDRIPLWYDIHGNLIPRYWEAMVRSVVQHIAMKAGSSFETLTAPYRGLVWEWEVRALVDWLVEVGVAAYIGAGAVVAREWWWTVVPKDAAAEVVGVDLEAENLEDGVLIVGDGADGVVEKVKAAASPVPAPKKRRVRGGKALRVGRG